MTTTNRYIAGIDEAGRGPVIGPMVMAIAACQKSDMQKLKSAGIKDSKLLTPQQRDDLFSLADSFPNEVISLSPKEIDVAVLGKSQGDNLNLLEARTTALLIYNLAKRIDLEKVIIDSPTKTVAKHEQDVRDALVKLDKTGITKKIELQCEIKADANHVIVGAASVLAKVTRDLAIEELTKIHGPMGSGYPSDPGTQAFLGKNWRNGNDFFRKSWETYARLARSGGQSSLGSFGEDDSVAKDLNDKDHQEIIAKFEVLKDHGFSFLPPTNQYEVVRMKNTVGTTVIHYTTGKTLVQGNDDGSTHALLQKLGLSLNVQNIDSKRPKARPKKN